MSNSGRPLSPHLSVYRWPITMVLSILHRVTGIAMSAGLVVFAAWLMQAAMGPESYTGFAMLLSTVPGRVVLALFSFAFFLHVANGVRHLVWDAGYGFERHQANVSAWCVIAFAILATALFWWGLS